MMKPQRVVCMATALGLLAAAAGSASAHVVLDSPNGGEVLTVGSTFSITWHVRISHATQNWDLWYSTESSAGPWSEIVMDLPRGDASVGAVHTFDWTVPDVVAPDVWVRVRMDNPGTDYFDVSNQSFAIVACPADIDRDGDADVADFFAFVVAFASGDPAADINGDGSIDVTDFFAFVAAFIAGCP